MKIRQLTLCAMFTALIAVCAWIALPFGQVNFTLQTLGIFLALGLLGGKWGTVSCAVYLLLGAVGLPVFSGFQSGIGALFGASGGFLWGFLIAGGSYWLATGLLGNSSGMQLAAMILGQLVCYTCGMTWYLHAYLGGEGVTAALMQCVLPYLLPDAGKLALAWILTRRLRRFL